ncbi:MAG: histidine phosphatase family protein [Chitinophagaceae bacterium]|nr:histidine phosphatase family protein [Chitinophagaceae bacterium]
MKLKILPAILLLICFTSCAQTYYVVRHAEKAAPDATMSSDVPLSAQGEQRAKALKELLNDKKIEAIYSTNTIRTKSTAAPTAAHFGLNVETYGPRPDSAFIAQLRALKKNTLIIGHSNTVDDIVNLLTGTKHVPADLPDSEYNKLYIITITGNKVEFKEEAMIR